MLVLVVALFALAFVAPHRSHGPQEQIDRKLESGQHRAAKAPGGLGSLLERPFGTSRKAAGKSAEAGRKSRFRLPF